jgi:drug/metabolite transporter (DMT)-like permease
VVLLGRVGGRYDESGLLVSQLLVTAVLCLPASVLLETPRLVLTAPLVGALALTGILATAGTTWLQLRFQPRVGATRAALLYTTEPVFAALFSAWWIGERLPAAGWAGGALILVAMVLSELGSGQPADPAGTPLGGAAGGEASRCTTAGTPERDAPGPSRPPRA